MTWEQACEHIETLNREMGGVQASLGWIKWILGSHVLLLLGILGVSVRTKYWVKKNGNNKGVG